ncbi:MAG: caspase family protein [Deltaproteobacteria bacterium]|nr:caspase family protein [Deltaproteobacteria bacterium]
MTRLVIVTELTLGILLLALHPSLGRTEELPEKSRAKPVFALVVGNNKAVEGQSNLRYADDDAVQNAAFMMQMGSAVNVRLLTTLDDETASLYPGLRPKEPSKKNIQQEMYRINEAMRAAKKKGARPEFFFFYTGHGNVKNNAGYITATDGRFTRDDLLALVKKSEATRNHLIIDACKSYFMVYERGPGGSRRKVTGKLEAADELPSNTGVFLSTSSAANSHEWEAISAGVFSHEVRSALRGGADLDLNQKITYEEAAAFIWNANRGIPVKKFRPAFYMRPPRGESASNSVLADLTSATGHWLHATPAKNVRQFIEDARGYRIAEFHPGNSRNMAILIPAERPLYVRRPEYSKEYEIPPVARVELTSLKETHAEVVTRGAENHAFLQLFSAPFGLGVLSEYHEVRYSDRDRLFNAPSRLKWKRNAIGVSSGLLAGAGLTMTLMALKKYKDAPEDESNLKTVARNDVIRRLNMGAVVCYVTAGVGIAAWVIWTLIANRKSASVLSGTGAHHSEAKWGFGGMILERRF